MERFITTDLVKMVGIYKIINTRTKDYYIGSSVNIYHRLRQHLSKLRRGIHINARLQAAWDKYGEESFSVIIITDLAEEDLRKTEFEMIEKEQPVYNLINDFREYYFDEETRNKMSESRKALMTTGSNNHESKPVECYDLDGKFVREFDSMSLALKHFRGNGFPGANQIGKCIRGERISAFGLQWKLKDDPRVIQPLSVKGKLNAIDGRKKLVLSNGKEFTNTASLLQYLNKQLVSISNGGSINLCLKLHVSEVPYKFRELLETPEEDNQQPSAVEIQ